MKPITKFILILAFLMSFKLVAQQYDEAKVYYNKGHDYATAKSYNEAIDCLPEAIARRPDYASAYRLRAWCYDEIKNYDRALQDIDKALTYYKESDTQWRSDAYQIKGDIHWNMKDYTNAELNYIYALGNSKNANEIISFLFKEIIALNSKVDSLTAKTKQEK